jgi:hypothetical protein
MAQEKHQLVYKLRDELLAELSDSLRKHYEGLAQAARAVHTMSLIDTEDKNRYVRIDFAYNLVRHITNASVNESVDHLRDKIRSNVSAPQIMFAASSCHADDSVQAALKVVVAPTALSAENAYFIDDIVLDEILVDYQPAPVWQYAQLIERVVLVHDVKCASTQTDEKAGVAHQAYLNLTDQVLFLECKIAESVTLQYDSLEYLDACGIVASLQKPYNEESLHWLQFDPICESSDESEPTGWDGSDWQATILPPMPAYAPPVPTTTSASQPSAADAEPLDDHYNNAASNSLSEQIRRLQLLQQTSEPPGGPIEDSEARFAHELEFARQFKNRHLVATAYKRLLLLYPQRAEEIACCWAANYASEPDLQ